MRLLLCLFGEMMTEQESKTPFYELPDQYKIYFTTETRERLSKGEVVVLELNNYQSVKIIDAKTELYTIQELIRKLKKIEQFDLGNFDDPDPFEHI